MCYDLELVGACVMGCSVCHELQRGVAGVGLDAPTIYPKPIFYILLHEQVMTGALCYIKCIPILLDEYGTLIAR